MTEAMHELRNVQWPTKNHAMRISTITAIFVTASAILLGVVDYLLGQLLLLTY
jgi:preprotein translocase SecE subunit